MSLTEAMVDLEKAQKRAAFWKEQAHRNADARDKWRRCPMSNCPQAPYTYGTQRALERHLREKHGAR